MMTNRQHYYASGHTAEGYHQKYESVLQDVQKLFLIKGKLSAQQSELLEELKEEAIDYGHKLHCLHSPSNNDRLEGIIFTDRQNAILVEQLAWNDKDIDFSYVPHTVVIDINQCVKTDTVEKAQDDINKLVSKINSTYQLAYDQFNKAREAHLTREKLYAEGFSVEKANHVSETLISSVLGDSKGDGNGKIERRFFGAATPEGVTHFIDELTESVQQRIIVKGRPGSGKSTMLKKLVAESSKLGFDSEVYHCGFDPNSLDMVHIPQLRVAVVDGTAPHELDPTREVDEILDMYELCFTKPIDDIYKEELEALNKTYKSFAKEGIRYLKEAKKLDDELMDLYNEHVNIDKLSTLKKTIKTQLLSQGEKA